MNLRKEIKTMLLQSIALSKKQKEYWLQLIPNLPDNKLQQLIIILKEEQEGINEILAEKIKNDKDGILVQKIKGFVKTERKSFLIDSEQKDRGSEENKLDKLLIDAKKC